MWTTVHRMRKLVTYPLPFHMVAFGLKSSLTSFFFMFDPFLRRFPPKTRTCCTLWTNLSTMPVVVLTGISIKSAISFMIIHVNFWVIIYNPLKIFKYLYFHNLKLKFVIPGSLSSIWYSKCKKNVVAVIIYVFGIFLCIQLATCNDDHRQCFIVMQGKSKIFKSWFNFKVPYQFVCRFLWKNMSKGHISKVNTHLTQP